MRISLLFLAKLMFFYTGKTKKNLANLIIAYDSTPKKSQVSKKLPFSSRSTDFYKGFGSDVLKPKNLLLNDGKKVKFWELDFFMM